jgi:thioredoxin 1
MPVGYTGDNKPKNKFHPMQRKSLFTREVTQNEKLTLALFRTEWNGACQIVSMIYEDLSKSYHDNAGFFTVDYEENPELGSEFGIREVPTILFFKSGQLVDHAVGLTAKNELIAKIETALNPSNTNPSINI